MIKIIEILHKRKNLKYDSICSSYLFADDKNKNVAVYPKEHIDQNFCQRSICKKMSRCKLDEGNIKDITNIK